MELVYDQFPFLLTNNYKYLEVPSRYLATLRGGSPKTLRNYGHILLEWFSFCEDNGLDWDAPTAQNVLDYVARFECGNRTRNYKIDRIKDYYAFAQHYGINNPFVRLIGTRDLLKAPVHKPVKVLPDLKKLRPFFDALPRNVRMMAVVMLYCGLRRGEVVRLQPRDLVGEPVNGAVSICVQCKGQTQRIAYMPNWLRDQLLAQCKGAYVFSHDGMPYCADSVSNAFAAASKIAGLRVYPHLLRHLYASHRYADLASASGQKDTAAALLVLKVELGHRHLTTTQEYIHSITARKIPQTHGMMVSAMIAKGGPK